jgi:hypothetical protein
MAACSTLCCACDAAKLRDATYHAAPTAAAAVIDNYNYSVLQWRLMRWRSYVIAVQRVKWAEEIALRMHTTRMLQRWHSKVSTYYYSLRLLLHRIVYVLPVASPHKVHTKR